MESLYYSPLQRDGRTERYALTNKLLLFLVCPIVAFVFSLKDAASKSSYVIYFLFGVLICWNFTYNPATQLNDFYGILNRFWHENITFGKLVNEFVSYYTFAKNAPKELYEHFMNWFCKSITPNYHFYFGLSGVVYLYFMLKSLWKITSDEKFDNSIVCIIILAMFVLPRDIFTVQNARFTTGLWLNIWATISFFRESERYNWKYFIPIAFSPFFHSGMWFYVFAFIGLVMLSRVSRLQKLYIILFYISIPFSYMSYEILSGINFSSLGLPSVQVMKLQGYLSKESFAKHVVTQVGTGFWWINVLFEYLTVTAYAMMPLCFWKCREQFKERCGGDNLLNFFLLFGALVNFIQFVPVLGERFYWMVQILSVYLWFKFIYPRYNKVIYFLLLANSWYIYKRYFFGIAPFFPYDTLFMNVPYSFFRNIML